jgi:hypothetical protein
VHFRLIKASAIVLGVGVAVTACAPVKMGAAAIVGNQRITIAGLDTEVTNLDQAVTQALKQDPGAFTLTPTQETQDALSWLIQYKIYDELASQAGISVNPAQAQAALTAVITNAEAAAEQQGLTHVDQNLILAANGIPPDTSMQLGQYEAIGNMYRTMVNGGQAPASQSAETAADTKLSHAECQAAKALNIQVNPQFGELSYTTYLIVSAPSAVTRTAGPTASASPVATAPAC